MPGERVFILVPVWVYNVGNNGKFSFH